MPLLVESSGIFDSIPFCSFLRKLFCNLFLLSISSFICFASLFYIFAAEIIIFFKGGDYA